MRAIISGGGTGGHIFPAIAIADGIRRTYPNAEILFVGAEGRMEMQRVPAAGYRIEGLPVVGLQRKLTLKNLAVPFKLFRSVLKASKILKEFQPDVVVGVGGYASGPIVWAAQKRNIPTVIQEQNSYAGLTNKFLGKRAKKICVAYPNMDRFFPKQKIVYTGNPIRENILNNQWTKKEACESLGLNVEKHTLLFMGGSLGAKCINQVLINHTDAWNAMKDNCQIIWQAGKGHFDVCKESATAQLSHVTCVPFLEKMDVVYSAADLVVCRAGALTVSEICVLGKASILVPSPYVAEDHQTKNAMALVDQEATVLIAETDLQSTIVEKLREVLQNDHIATLEKRAKAMGKPEALNDILSTIKESL